MYYMKIIYIIYIYIYTHVQSTGIRLVDQLSRKKSHCFPPEGKLDTWTSTLSLKAWRTAGVSRALSPNISTLPALLWLKTINNRITGSSSLIHYGGTSKSLRSFLWFSSADENVKNIAKKTQASPECLPATCESMLMASPLVSRYPLIHSSFGMPFPFEPRLTLFESW